MPQADQSRVVGPSRERGVGEKSSGQQVSAEERFLRLPRFVIPVVHLRQRTAVFLQRPAVRGIEPHDDDKRREQGGD